MRAPACTGPVAHGGSGPIDAELAALVAAATPHSFGGLFCTAASPGIVAAAMTDRYYGDPDAYLDAVADALAPEYQAILGAGLVLQIDAPDLAMEAHCSFADRSTDEFIRFAGRVVAAINRALGPDVPRERVRLHVCWGNYDGPHHLDLPLEALIDTLNAAHVGSLFLASANPRHAHEVRLFDRFDPSWTMVAGVIDTTSNYVEHPEVVADRIVRVVEAVGDPARVMAATDCGFATAAGLGDVAAEVAWLKLASLVEGTQLANRRLGLG